MLSFQHGDNLSSDMSRKLCSILISILLSLPAFLGSTTTLLPHPNHTQREKHNEPLVDQAAVVRSRTSLD